MGYVPGAEIGFWGGKAWYMSSRPMESVGYIGTRIGTDKYLYWRKDDKDHMKQLTQEQQQKLNGVIAQTALAGMTEPATATPGVAVDTEALMAELARLRAENEALRVSGQRRISFKVSEKGAVSVYGLGAYPQTLYKEQWEALFGKVPELKEFIAKAEAADLLATPEQKAARKAEAKAQREAAALAAKTKA